jgi:phospholipid/cholesterol/gamma-HCH transport system substrate-binding protein
MMRRARAQRAAAYASLPSALAAVVIVVLTSGQPQYTVTAEFTDVRGLVAGAQIRLAGVPVGSVTRIWLGRDGWPRTELAVDGDVILRERATAAVRLASVSGEFNRYVSIVQGAGPALPRGAIIPRTRTSSPVEFDQALGTFDPATRAALTEALAGLRQTVSGRGPAIAATLRSAGPALAQISALSGDVGGDGGALRQLLASAHVLSDTLAQRSQELSAAVDQTRALLATLAGQAAALGTGLGALPAGLDAAHGTLAGAQALIAPAKALLDAATGPLAQLPATAVELRTAMNAAGPALAGAAKVAELAPGSARRLQPVLDAAGPGLSTAIPVLRRLGPMLDQLRVRLPDAFAFFANWADFTSNYDSGGHAARVGIVLPPAPLNVLSPSSNGPGQLAPPYLRTPGSLEGQPWADYWKSFVAGGTPAADAPGAPRPAAGHGGRR